MRWTVEFEAMRRCRLFGRVYQKGDIVKLEYIGPGLADDWVDEHFGKGGPWGWGGYTSEDIEAAFRPIDDR